MLAARDQENLVHGHRTTAASKPLNQGTKSLAPKTPGNKAPKTPFKLPLNDENAPAGFGGGKAGLKVQGRGHDDLGTGAKKATKLDKNAFVTPMGPRSRAPLGLKTTNAKAKALQTPAPPAADNDLDKTKQKSATARKPKPKPRVTHAEMTKVDMVGEMEEPEEREIEYMPPKPTPLPDYPDDWPHDVDYSRFEGRGLTRGWYQYYCNPIGEDGLTLTSRRWKEQGEKLDKEIDEQTQREIDNMPLLGINVPEFPGEETIEERVRRMKMEDEVKKKALDGPSKSSNSNEKALATNGPATIKSRKAAAILSQSTASGTAPARKPLTTATKARMPFSLLGGKKKTPPPTNPSPMRHTAAVTASRTTMGYSKGRATSSTIRKSILPKNKASTGASAEVPDTTLAPAVYIQKYGEPPVGSDMWIRCAQLGCFKDDDDNLDDVLKSTLPASLLVDEEDEEEFQFVC